MSLSLRLVCNGKPVVGSVRLDVGGKVLSAATDKRGEVVFRGVAPGSEPTITAIPHSGYWQTVYQGVPTSGEIHCEALPTDLSQPWWLALLGLLAPGVSADGVSIGIIDNYFGPPWEEPPQVPKVGGKKQLEQPTHGQLIASLLTTHSDFPSPCPQASLKVISAPSVDNPNRIGMAAVTEGIVALTDGGVDVISMSFGKYGANDRGVRNSLEYAASRGVLLVAASGNSSLPSPAFPACDHRVVAVSGVAMPGYLPDNSLAFQSMAGFDSEATLKLRKMAEGGLCFWLPSNEIDDQGVAAPGAGIIVRTPDGRLLDVVGTSFAAPLVAAAAAVLIAGKSSFRNRISDLDHNRKLLYSHCSLTDRSRANLTGRGIPVVA